MASKPRCSSHGNISTQRSLPCPARKATVTFSMSRNSSGLVVSLRNPSISTNSSKPSTKSSSSRLPRLSLQLPSRDFAGSPPLAEFFLDQRTHHDRIVVGNFAQGVHDMELFLRNQFLGLQIILRAEPRDCRLAIHNLASQDFAVHFERAPLLD